LNYVASKSNCGSVLKLKFLLVCLHFSSYFDRMLAFMSMGHLTDLQNTTLSENFLNETSLIKTLWSLKRRGYKNTKV